MILRQLNRFRRWIKRLAAEPRSPADPARALAHAVLARLYVHGTLTSFELRRHLEDRGRCFASHRAFLEAMAELSRQGVIVEEWDITLTGLDGTAGVRRYRLPGKAVAR